LRALLPAFPDGDVIEHPFLPRISEMGKRHPVTRDLSGGDKEPPNWGEWTRQISTGNVSGMAVMKGEGDEPLLILRHEKKGRVALLLSDQSWLWARNFRGGGPHLDLLRRTGHWLMKEPELEEEALRAFAKGDQLTIERQTMADAARPVTLTSPSGATQSVTLDSVSPGLWRSVLTLSDQGLYSATDGELSAFASLGPANPHEFQHVISTLDRLQALAGASGGSVRRITARIPAILSLSSGARLASGDFIAFRKTESANVLGLSLWPIFVGLGGLALLAGGLLAGWLAEARGFRFRRPPAA
jgi:hypothetical protein